MDLYEVSVIAQFNGDPTDRLLVGDFDIAEPEVGQIWRGDWASEEGETEGFRVLAVCNKDDESLTAEVVGEWI